MSETPSPESDPSVLEEQKNRNEVFTQPQLSPPFSPSSNSQNQGPSRVNEADVVAALEEATNREQPLSGDSAAPETQQQTSEPFITVEEEEEEEEEEQERHQEEGDSSDQRHDGSPTFPPSPTVSETTARPQSEAQGPSTPIVISAGPVLSSSYTTPSTSTLNGFTPTSYSPTGLSAGALLSRATHPSVMRKDLAREGVIRLFCGGLSFESDETTLSGYFQRYGQVVDCRIAREVSTNRHRGFGFVAIRTPKFNPAGSEEDNLRALDELKRQIFAESPHEIQGRRITVQEENRAGEGPKAGTPSTGGLGGRFDHRDEAEHQEPRVFVANLDATWGQDVLREYFTQFGEVVEVHIVTDANGVSRNFAFVTFATPEIARKVCDGPLDWDPSTHKRRRSAKHQIHGREVTVREADPKRGRARPSAASGPMHHGIGHLGSHHPQSSHHIGHHPGHGSASSGHVYGGAHTAYAQGHPGASVAANWGGYPQSAYGQHAAPTSGSSTSDPHQMQQMMAAAAAAYGTPQAFYQGMMMMPSNMFYGQQSGTGTSSQTTSSSTGQAVSPSSVWAGYYSTSSPSSSNPK